MKIPPAAGLVVGVVAVSFASVLIKLCHQPPLTIAAYRLMLAAAFFLVLAAVRKGTPLHRSDVAWALGAGVFLAIHFATWITSLAYTTVATSVVLVTTNPIFVAVGSHWLLGEKSSGRVWGGIALGISGSLLVGLGSAATSADAPRPLLGAVLALAGAVAGSGYFLIGRHVRARVDTTAYITFVYTAAAVLLLLLALVSGSPMHGFEWRDWGLLVLIAAVPQALGHTVLNWALRFLSTVQVAVAILGEPVGASILAWLMLGQTVNAAQAGGALLIFAGVLLSSWPSPA